MAHAADFHGNQLRLSAFLRVMGKVPERPKRLQRTRQALLPLPKQDGLPGATQSMYQKPAAAVEPAQDENAGLPDDDMPPAELESRGRTSQEPSSSKDGNISRAGSRSSATVPSILYAQTGSVMEQRHSAFTEAAPVVKRKKKIVYTAGKKQPKQPMGVLNARKKHPLPENGLVFVRASTVDGSGTGFNEHIAQQDLVHPSVELEFQDLRQDSAESPLRDTAENTVRNQLARITAPSREDDTSESSDLDEEASVDISRWGLDDPPKSTDPDDPDLRDSGFDLGAEEMGYFGGGHVRHEERRRRWILVAVSRT
ncbi:uncharacterized protein N0V89_007805 [Didymosphaeria variabile]|uniref:Uncharacterized protein n=1 Tax=Didymosphaeria variabile TaxID=1932322 RepID=A0A9W8XKA2_9PLEO|nr:uncharacterized protein N0V89_007805 [Didymosphaeria variabile]KAJ4352457.1 hypothetical protein N0V89_007805 [Didymosphaeria variabile]